MDLLTNAISSIRVGVEDSQSTDHDRLLSAVRNIHAGILLLYKEKLRRLSPPDSDEVLLKARILPKRTQDGQVVFVGQGKKTADAQQIEERFAALGVATDWNRFRRIGKVRNNVEHYYAQITPSQLRAVISDAFLLVRDFVVSQLAENPRELLGEEVWQEMLKVSEVFEAERRGCEQLLQSIVWSSDTVGSGVLELECAECGTPLLQPDKSSAAEDDVQLECRACGAQEERDSFVPRAIASVLEHEMYLSHTDGNETPYVTCPECLAETYVIEEGRCALCGHEAEHSCSVCGADIPPEELDSSPLCGWCAHMMSKDD